MAGAYSRSSAGQFPEAGSIGELLDSGAIGQGDPAEITGSIAVCCELMPDGWSADLAVNSVRYRGTNTRAGGTARLYVRVSDTRLTDSLDAMRIGTGSKVRVAATLTREERYSNPGGRSTLKALERDGIDATAFVKSPILIEPIAGASCCIVNNFLNGIRNSLIRGMLARFDQPASGILIASLLGNRHFIDSRAATAFRSGGTFHVLVVSGIHVTMIGTIVIWFASVAGFGRKSRVFTGCAAVWTFAMLAGSGVPVMRASLMFTFLCLATAVRLPVSPGNSLGACALLILAADPAAVDDPSFLLTFGAAAAITVVALPVLGKCRAIGSWYPTAANPLPPLSSPWLRSVCEFLYWNPAAWESAKRGNVWQCVIFKSRGAIRFGGGKIQKLLRLIFEGATVSVAVQLSLLPLQVLFFHRISPAALVLNIFAGPFLALQSALSLGALLFGELSDSLSGNLASVGELLVTSWIALQTLMAGSLLPELRIPIYSGGYSLIYWIYAISVAGASVCLYRWDPFERRSRRGSPNVAKLLFAVTLVTGLVIVLHPFSEPAADKNLTAYFLDVGQGDSVFLRFPDGRTMLIDGGGSMRFGQEGGETEFVPDRLGVGESVVSEFLWEQGISSLDFVLVTHSDIDHIQGLLYVIKNFRVGAVLYGRDEPDSGEFAALADEAARRHVPMKKVKAGDMFLIGGASVNVLNPSGSRKERTRNDASVVVKVAFGQRSFLLAGDIERDAESAILESGESLRADVIKVAHHGSRTSSSPNFVEAVDAEYAVIPVGKRSRFGHPHAEVVQRWEKSGASVYETGKWGTVTLSTDGAVLELQTFRSLTR